MIKRILEIDRDLLVFLNNLGSELWDPIWLLITDKLTFIPIFLFLIYRFFKDFGVKQALKILLSISILIFSFPFWKEPCPSVIFFNPNLFSKRSNGKNSPKGTSFCLLYC